MAKVLVVDDSRNIREYCRRELTKCGYRVLLAENGLEAIALLDIDLPDVIVLDIRMPQLDGLETMAQLAGRKSSIPVILYTANPCDLSLDFRSWGAFDCLEKNEDLQDLKSAIARALEHSRSEWQPRENRASSL